MRKATDQCDAQTISLLWTCLLLFHGGDVICFDVCHVIWCGGHVIWCDVIACVVSCHVMQCDVLWCALMRCALQWLRCVFCDKSVLKVLLQYYSVLQSTTPVLLCTTQYYNVLLQYYSVLQSSIHDWSLTHMNCHLHDWCPSHMKRHLQCAEQQESSSNFAKYCTCHAKWLWWLIRVTYETSFTMRGATGITLQPHQILRLPRKKNLVFDPRYIWNVIYNARSNRHHPATSTNTAPATQNGSHDWSSSHMERHLQCAEQQASPSNLTKYCACHAKVHSKI